MEGQMEGRTDPILFIEPFWIPPGVQQVQLHWTTFKGQGYKKGYCSNQNYYTTVSMQKICLIQKLILTISRFYNLLN